MSIKNLKFHISTEIFYFFQHHVSQSEEKMLTKSSLNVFETKLYKKRQSFFDFQKKKTNFIHCHCYWNALALSYKGLPLFLATKSYR